MPNSLAALANPAMFPDTDGLLVSKRDLVRVLVPPEAGASAADIASKAKAILPSMDEQSVRRQLDKLVGLGEVRREGDTYVHVCGPIERPKPRVRARRTI